MVPGIGHKYREFYSQITKARTISAEKKKIAVLLPGFSRENKALENDLWIILTQIF